jgi:hypothetical protein
MAPPFDDRWPTLTLEHLQAFLDRELEERLTWEAKGSHEPRAEQVRVRPFRDSRMRLVDRSSGR